MNPIRRVRPSRILGLALLGVALLSAVGFSAGLRINLNDPAIGFLTWGPTAGSGPAPTPEQAFLMRDKLLTARFAALKSTCASRWTTEAACLTQLQQMRAMEEALFEDVRAHEFSNINESDYWHRGRLKFPSEIEQELSRAVPQ
jgi:hypothetical protein